MGKAANRIKWLIEDAKKHGLTKKRIAEGIGMSQQNLSNLLYGQNYWKIEQLERLSKFLGIPLAEIFDEDRQFFVYGEKPPPRAGKLSRRQTELIAKLKDILLYGSADNPEDDLALAITANINAMWICLIARPTKTNAKAFSEKKKAALSPPPPQKISDITSSDDIIEGERPPPG
jgi:transcriptional regulator with XRE-family HTH domain